ncbi:hypothetical protein [Neorhizobium sp. T25_27]|uniref:hypothetical protein n=1 Tax=Neorhizobium sp. T25_27 TaxID=2093831 RepID=UPI000CFA287B|nr:hypothetical protein [Neorhizobium sp. T25_27]
MTTESMLHDIPGGKAVVEWFGRAPRFHDANLLELTFSGKGAGLLRIHAWNMTDKVDSEGYFVLEKHATITLALEGVSSIECANFDMVPGIILALEITKPGEHFRIEWSASYGANGLVTARQVQIGLTPGKPD